MDSTHLRARVARTGPALQVTGRPAHPVDSTHPRRAVPARTTGSPTGRSQRRGPRRGCATGTCRRAQRGADERIRTGYTMIDKNQRRGAAAASRADPIRHPSTRVPGVGASTLRIGGLTAVADLVAARGLPSLLPLDASRAARRYRRDRGLLRYSSGRRLPLPSGTGDPAVGAVRSSQSPRPDPPPPDHAYYRSSQAATRGKLAALGGRPQARPPLLPHAAHHRRRGGVRHRGERPGGRRPGPFTDDTSIRGLSSRKASCIPNVQRRAPSNTEPTALPTRRGSSNQDCCRRRPTRRRAPS